MKKILPQHFPELLGQIPHPPRYLYSRGGDFVSLEANSAGTPARGQTPYIALVGTRTPSTYGKKMAHIIARKIASAGGIVVSGLAFGIDAIAHRAALDVRRPTVAVLASGVDNVTPRSHISLAEKIVHEGGLLLSEYERFDSAHKYRFLERNRIISGLASTTIVIEAKKRSGALITAHHAFEQERDVYALMGDIDRPQAQGCLDLVRRDIASPIVSIEHLLDVLGLKSRKTLYYQLNTSARNILETLETRPQSSQDIVENTGYTSMIVNSQLSILEMKSLIQRMPDGKWHVR